MSCAIEIAIAMLGEPNRRLSSKQELRFGSKGSVSVALTDRKAGLWYDHEQNVGGDLLDLIRHVHGCGFLDAANYVLRFIGSAPIHSTATTVVASVKLASVGDVSIRNRHRACELWKDAVPTGGTVAGRYLATRGILTWAGDAQGNVLRFHPQCPYGEKTRHPCLLALMRDIHTNEPRAIHRTALTQTGEKIGRMILGPKTSSAIKLSSDEDVTMGLTVGEGLETILSAMQLGFSPAWALGDAGNVRAFPVLSGVECLTIVVDNDDSETGQRAALECSRRWTDSGREVFRVVPDRCGDDMNDVIQRTLL